MALKKNPNPTFKQPVEIPVPGEKPEKVEFTYKYMSKSDYKAFIESASTKEDAESAAEILIAWPMSLEKEFGEVSQDNIADFFESYPGAPGAVISGFIKGLHQGRTGN